MKYALNLAEDDRILSATYEEYATEGLHIVDELPDGDLHDYLYSDGSYVYDPVPDESGNVVQDPQADTDAMLVDHEYRLTLLELGLTE